MYNFKSKDLAFIIFNIVYVWCLWKTEEGLRSTEDSYRWYELSDMGVRTWTQLSGGVVSTEYYTQVVRLGRKCLYNHWDISLIPLPIQHFLLASCTNFNIFLNFFQSFQMLAKYKHVFVTRTWFLQYKFSIVDNGQLHFASGLGRKPWVTLNIFFLYAATNSDGLS